MPAIEFSRLRTKIELLGRVFYQPEQFIKDLSDLYFFYSDLTFQFNNQYEKTNAQLAYRTPVVINRELEHSLKPLASLQPHQTFAIVDHLWATGILEPCQLAAALLGAINLENKNEALKRIHQWSTLSSHPDLINVLHIKASETIRRQEPQTWLSLLSEWYEGKNQTMRKFAIQGLLPLIDDPGFVNLPIIFDFLQPILSNPDSRYTTSLLNIIEKLKAKTESETIYFLKQIIITSSSSDTPRFIRRCLPLFSESAQNSLKNCLRDNLK